MIIVYISVGVFLLAFIVVISLLLNSRKEVRRMQQELDNREVRHGEERVGYNRQVDLRNEYVKKLLHENLDPETLSFFIHLTDFGSHIPDHIFEKVSAYQEFIAKKKKEEG
jgi:hypothetical protein